MAGHFETLLTGLADSPAQRLSQLSLLSEPERRMIVCDWNRTAAPYPGDRCINELFEAQAKETPGATAVVYGDEAMSYEELDHYLVTGKAPAELKGKIESMIAASSHKRLPPLVADFSGKTASRKIEVKPQD